MQISRCALLFSLLLALVSSAQLASAELRSLTLAVDTVASDVDVTVGIYVPSTFSSDSQTISDVDFSGAVQTELDLGEAPGFGVVAESLRFVSGEVVVADTLFDQLQVLLAVPTDVAIETQGMSGAFDDATLTTGAPTAANTVPVDLTPIDLVFDMGSLAVTLTPPGSTSFFGLSQFPLVFDLGQTGSVVTAGSQVTVTVPVDEIATASALGIVVQVALAGDLVLTGTLPPPVDVPALAPLPLAAATLLLALVGLLAARRWRAAPAQSTSIP